MTGLPDRPFRYLITRGDSADSNFLTKKDEIVEIVRRSVEAGIEMIQLREKGLSARYLYELAVLAVDAVAGAGTKILVNDRFDIALAAGADGVHLTGSSLSSAIVRRNVPAGFLIGVSTHTEGEAVAARELGADFALFGPVFATPAKGEPAGLELLKAVCDTAKPLPVVAVGGIDGTNCDSIITAGGAGYAAIRYLNDFVIIEK